MRISNMVNLACLMLLGCASEHTIADESLATQMVSVIARPICVEMCEYTLACGHIESAELGSCLNQCETDCTRLEASSPTLVNPTNPALTASAAGTIDSVYRCYLASECSLDKLPACYPKFIGAQANIVEGKPESSVTGITGLSSCGMREDLLNCESTIAQGRNSEEAWDVSCERTDVTATEWSCSCVEYGIKVATTKGTPEAKDVAMLELCWTKEQLACFYGGSLNCGLGSGALQ